MSFYAKVIADSIHRFVRDGTSHDETHRLTTFELSYPRFIHGELMTHRVFSRNAASSRAIPVAKMLEQVLTAPAGFVHVGANRPGMQAHEEVSEEVKAKFNAERAELAKLTAEYVSRWSEEYGIHKQVANRHLEPWQWMKTIVSATEWDNFFALRCHPDAQPEFQHLANLIKAAYDESTPAELTIGGWHLPYVSPDEKLSTLDAIRASTARCARVSYKTHDGAAPELAKDIKLYEMLMGSVPIHASPAEHQATPSFLQHTGSNFKGWMQHRTLHELKLMAES